MSEAPSATGYVYMIRGADWVKIGLSKDPERRMRELGTKPPFDLTLLYVFPALDPRELETKMHSFFSDKREGGEWFRLTDEEVFAGKAYAHVLMAIEQKELAEALGDGWEVVWHAGE